MKKLLLAAIALLTMCNYPILASAQNEGPKNKDGQRSMGRPEMKEKRLEFMTEKYKLTAEQQEDLKKLFESEEQARQNNPEFIARKQRQARMDSIRKKMNVQREEFESKVKGILTEEQFAQYSKDKKNRLARCGEHRREFNSKGRAPRHDVRKKDQKENKGRFNERRQPEGPQGQFGPMQKGQNHRAEQQLKYMKERYQLTGAQQASIKKLMQKRTKDFSKGRRNLADAKKNFKAEQKAYNAELKKIMNKKQYTLYKKDQKARAKERKQKQGGKAVNSGVRRPQMPPSKD